MTEIVVLSPLPPVRSDASMAGSALVRLLRTGRHSVRAPWPFPESVEAVLGAADLAVYHLSNDLEDRDVYELALEKPGLVVLHDLVLDRVVRGLVRSRDPVGIESAREALAASDLLGSAAFPEPLSVPWCSLVVRRARGLVVHSTFAARYLEALGVRTPTFIAPHPAVAHPPAARAARRRARRLRRRLGGGAVLGVVGDLGRQMGLEMAVEASRGLAMPASVVAIGHQGAADETTAFMASFDSGPVIWAAQLSESEMTAWVAACDVILDLGHPPRPTVPTSVVRALQLGVPVVASSPMSVPDGTQDAAVLLGSSPPDPAEVVGEVTRILANPRSAGAAGKLAVELMAASAAPVYLEAVDRTSSLLQDPFRWTLGRWASALVDSGVPEGWVGRGYGAAYTDALEELRPR
jgi:hypothetical protein